MIKIEVKGIDGILNDVDDLIKNRIPKMTAIALTETAKALKEAGPAKMQEVFDRPTRWTLNSLFYQPASPADLKAFVWFKDDLAVDKGTPAVKYLWPEVHGGQRNLKRFESALRRFGVLLNGYFTVPGAGAKLDSSGNMRTGQITEILTGIGALVGMSDTTFNDKLGGYKRRKQSTANFFVVKEKHGGLVPGIYQRFAEKGSGIKGLKGPKAMQKGERQGKFYSVIQGRKVIPVLIFVKGAPAYKARFPFYEWAQAFIDRELPIRLNRIIGETLAYHKAKG